MSRARLRRTLELALFIIAMIGFGFGCVIVCLSPHPFLWGAFVALLLVWAVTAGYLHHRR